MNDKKWKSYEDVAAYLLNQFSDEFGVTHVEPSQVVTGRRSKTSWKIDAKAFLADGEGFLIVECRRYTTSKQNQEKLAGLAYRILDSGADGGIIVSPTGLQAGAEKIAIAENIMNIELDENSTPHEFGMRFLNKIFVGFHERIIGADFMEIEILRICKICRNRFVAISNEQICPACSLRT
ncbi:MAG: hypothetical protein B7Z35_00095 [Hydrogenophilales bacterium 12-61-10]|nr:MAG: hypothetical protein B7Z35_00095 [Hydrogenophilales bacterium 12-61-10]